MFMSPAMVRRASSAVSSPLARRKASNLDDERDLIIPSPTDSECNSIVNGNDLVDSGSGSGTGSGSGNAGDLASSVPETGFSLPKFKSNMRSSKVSQDFRGDFKGRSFVLFFRPLDQLDQEVSGMASATVVCSLRRHKFAQGLI